MAETEGAWGKEKPPQEITEKEFGQRSPKPEFLTKLLLQVPRWPHSWAPRPQQTGH